MKDKENVEETKSTVDKYGQSVKIDMVKGNIIATEDLKLPIIRKKPTHRYDVTGYNRQGYYRNHKGVKIYVKPAYVKPFKRGTGEYIPKENLLINKFIYYIKNLWKKIKK